MTTIPATLDSQQSNSLLHIAVVSTPRSGNTWLRSLLAKTYALKQLAQHNPEDLDWNQLPTRCVLQIHWHRAEPFLSLLKHHNFHVVSLSRHPLDVLISILHFARNESETGRWLEGEGGSETGILRASPRSREFLEYATGPRASSLLSVSREWWQAPGSLQLRYEELVRDPAEALKRLGEAMDCPASGAAIAEAIATNSLDSLRKNSSNQHFWRGRPDHWRRLLTTTEALRIAYAQRASFDELDYECDPDESLSEAQADANWEQELHKDLIMENARLMAETIRLKAQSVHYTIENGNLRAQNGHLTAENSRLSAQIDHFTAQNGHLAAQNSHLTAQNGHLTIQNGHFIADNAGLRAECGRLTAETIDLKAEHGRLVAESDCLGHESAMAIATLQGELAALRAAASEPILKKIERVLRVRRRAALKTLKHQLSRIGVRKAA
jgi:hypothetical protein